MNVIKLSTMERVWFYYIKQLANLFDVQYKDVETGDRRFAIYIFDGKYKMVDSSSSADYFTVFVGDQWQRIVGNAGNCRLLIWKHWSWYIWLTVADMSNLDTPCAQLGHMVEKSSTRYHQGGLVN